MAFLSSLNIPASALTAQRLRMDIAAENISNMDITRTENGGPYRRKVVVFEQIKGRNFRTVLTSIAGRQQAGVRVGAIIEDQSPFKPVYNPAHPDAGEDGYVLMPNVDILKETIDSMAATRAYDANLTVLNAIKQMATKALNIGK